MLLLLSLLRLCETQKVCNFRSSFFFSTPFLSGRFFRRTPESSYNELLLRKRETTIGPISLVTRHKVCVTNVLVICDACDPCNATCFTLFTVTRIHNIWKYTKIKNSKDRKGSKDREINLISTKSWKKIKSVFKRRNWLIHKVKVILTPLLKNSSHQKT